METRNLKILFVLIIALIFILLIALFVGNGAKTKSNLESNATGEMQTFEISDEDKKPQYQPTKTSDRYDDKYLDYLDNIQESRDKTFQR